MRSGASKVCRILVIAVSHTLSSDLVARIPKAVYCCQISGSIKISHDFLKSTNSKVSTSILKSRTCLFSSHFHNIRAFPPFSKQSLKQLEGIYIMWTEKDCVGNKLQGHSILFLPSSAESVNSRHQIYSCSQLVCIMDCLPLVIENLFRKHLHNTKYRFFEIVPILQETKTQ